MFRIYLNNISISPATFGQMDSDLFKMRKRIQRRVKSHSRLASSCAGGSVVEHSSVYTCTSRHMRSASILHRTILLRSPWLLTSWSLGRKHNTEKTRLPLETDKGPMHLRMREGSSVPMQCNLSTLIFPFWCVTPYHGTEIRNEFRTSRS